MNLHYVRPDGTYVGGYSESVGDIPQAIPTVDDAAPSTVEELICIDHQFPDYADQVWQFPGWSESIGKKTRAETAWRNAEMLNIADQLLRLEDSDPTALPGTAAEWREYRIKVRAWVDGADGYPESGNRPERPSQ